MLSLSLTKLTLVDDGDGRLQRAEGSSGLEPLAGDAIPQIKVCALFDTEDVCSGALRHAIAQNHVGLASQSSKEVGQEDRMLCLRATEHIHKVATGGPDVLKFVPLWSRTVDWRLKSV